MMPLWCRHIGDKRIAIESVRFLGQVYRFDNFEITILNKIRVVFEVPSTEWLEEFTKFIRSKANHCIDITLTGSGFPLKLWRTEDGVGMRIFDLVTGNSRDIELSDTAARELHACCLDIVLTPFKQQGGDPGLLEDLKSFLLE